MALSSLAGLLLVGWLAPSPWLVEQWPRALAIGLFVFVFMVPRWFVPARSPASLAAVADPAARGRLEDDRLKLQNDVRIGLLQAVAGVAVIVAVAVTWQQLETERHQLRQQLAGERFTRALDQLGSEQLDVRLGGIYGLERIAASASGGQLASGGSAAYRMLPEADPLSVGQWASQDRVQVFEILSAYVRAHSHRPPVGPVGAAASQVRQADVHAAATVLARRTVLPGDPPLDLGGSLLQGARLGWARLAGADLRGADIRGVSLQHADLVGVHLEQSLLCGAQLQGADLRGAHLAGAHASGDTQWPSGFDWRAAGARLVDPCG